MSSVPVYNWEVAARDDPNLKLINEYVQKIISKLPGQPAPRADAGRGSRYEPAPPVKSEGAMPTTSNSSQSPSPQFIYPRDYQSESSSEYDMREVDPMDELSDCETDASKQLKEKLQIVQEEQETPTEEQPMEGEKDVEMEQEQEQEQQQQQQMQEEQEMESEVDKELGAAPQPQHDNSVCEVCKSSERESEIVLCDDCDAEYHIFCLEPPLARVPEEHWSCPKCSGKHSEPDATATAVQVQAEQVRVASASAGNESAGTGQPPVVGEDAAEESTEAAPSGSVPPSDNAPTDGVDENDPTSIPIAQTLEGNPEKSNLLLIHACNCDDVKCTDAEFHLFCPHMKRFLRSVCWASHSDKWRSYRLARVTAEMFAYHAMHCTLGECNVPLCVKIREERIV